MSPEKHALIDRIEKMEARLDRAEEVLDNLETAVNDYIEFKEDLDALQDYIDSGQWQKDFEADEAGEIPVGLPREVLSEDYLYNLLEHKEEIVNTIKATFVWKTAVDR